jgi:uncharacterized protein DUF4129
MNSPVALKPALLLALLVSLAPAIAHAGSISVSEYRRQLSDISGQIESLKLHPEQAARVVTAIPDEVSVTTGSGAVTVKYKSLKDDLASFSSVEADKRTAFLKKIGSYVQSLRVAADAYEKNAEDPGPARDKLNRILAMREFSKVNGPSAKDALLARIYRWLSRILSKNFPSKGSKFDLMQLLIYLLVAAAVTLLVIWTVRRLRRPHEELPGREIIPFAPSARSWRAWLAEARTLATQQDWRNAIHLAYWAGISYLEEHGAWKPNRARTPREYLRLIGTRAAPYPVLAALTRKLEVVWYGYGTARESDFEEALEQLQQLGCR